MTEKKKKLLMATILAVYLMINEMIGHFEEKNENKYLVLDNVGENKEISKKCEELWDGVKNKLKRLMVMKKLNARKISKKVGLSQMMTCQWINLHLLTIIIMCVFTEGGKFYPQLFLDDALYDLV